MFACLKLCVRVCGMWQLPDGVVAVLTVNANENSVEKAEILAFREFRLDGPARLATDEESSKVGSGATKDTGITDRISVKNRFVASTEYCCVRRTIETLYVYTRTHI